MYYNIQIGGVKCSLCGSEGTNKSTCPLNPNASAPNYNKHNVSAGSAVPIVKTIIPTVKQSVKKISPIVKKPVNNPDIPSIILLEKNDDTVNALNKQDMFSITGNKAIDFVLDFANKVSNDKLKYGSVNNIQELKNNVHKNIPESLAKPAIKHAEKIMSKPTQLFYLKPDLFRKENINDNPELLLYLTGIIDALIDELFNANEKKKILIKDLNNIKYIDEDFAELLA
jgi:hypothetical protein